MNIVMLETVLEEDASGYKKLSESGSKNLKCEKPEYLLNRAEEKPFRPQYRLEW